MMMMMMMTVMMTIVAEEVFAEVSPLVLTCATSGVPPSTAQMSLSHKLRLRGTPTYLRSPSLI